MATIDEIKQQAEAVKNATQVGENTAERVGGALAGLADIAEQQDVELGKKFDKESVVKEFGDSEDKVVSQFALPFRMVENSKYLYAIVDAVNHFLAGIQKDGSIEWSKGIPTPIRVKLEAVIKQTEQNKSDITKILSSLNNAISVLNKTTIKNEDGSVVETPLCYKQNERVVYAKTDADGKMLLGFKKKMVNQCLALVFLNRFKKV